MRLQRVNGSVTGRSWAWCIGKAAWLAFGLLILGSGQVLQAQVTVFSEGFEGAFPEDNGWTVGDAGGAGIFWEDVNAAFGGEGTQAGSWKGYCAGTAYPFNSSEPFPFYDDEMLSFMQRPIDLTSFGCAQLEFWYKIPSIETCCDTLRVTIDGTQVFIQNNPVGDWTLVLVDLGPFLGGVRTLRFEFITDFSVTAEGAYLDSIRVTGTLPPGNNNFAAATVINGPSGTVVGNNICATGEAVEPGNSGRTVWWAWQSPVCCPVTFNTFGSSYDTLLCVFTGPNLGALTTVGCNDDAAGGFQSRVDFTPTELVTYWIRVDGFSGAQGDITLNWGVTSAPPANDNFANATPLSGPNGTINGHNCNATSEAGEPSSGLDGGHSVWYRWQSPTCCPMKFSTLGSCFDTVLCVYTGEALDSLTPLGCNDDFPGKGLQSRVEFTATEFTTYWIRVDGYWGLGGREGDIVLSWEPNVPAPANNQFANAIFLPGDRGVVNGHTCNATSEGGEPIDFRASGRTVWYSWYSGGLCCPVYFSTLGACFDTVMCVYTGPDLASLTPVACVDDSLGKGLASRVTFNSQVGTLYWIQVDGYFSLGGRVGDFVLQYGPAGLPPGNDQFANATVLAGASGTGIGHNCGATREDYEPVDFRGGGNTAWYKWIAPNAGCVFFNTLGSCFDTVLSVFEGSDLNNLEPIATNNDDFPGKGLQSRVEFRTQTGRTYWIQVDGFAGGMGDITLNWGADATPPLNDNFAGAAFLPGDVAGRALGGNCNATGEAGEPANAARTVWWRWTAPANGCTWFSTLGSDFDTLLCLYTGGTLATLTQVGCVDDSVGKDVRSRVEFTATAGTVYWIRVDGFDSAIGNIVLRWGNGPENDNLANAAFLAPAGTIIGNNRCATLEAGELNVAPGGGKTIWYRWTAPSSGCPRYFFSSRGSSFDTVLCVFHGAGGVGALILDGCNDDFAGKSPASRVELNVTPGTTYAIRLDGYSGVVGVEEGDITLTWGPVGPPPANDNFATATVIAGASGTTSGQNCAATAEAGEPIDPIGGGKTVWYCWTAPSSGCVFFNTLGSSYDTLICAYTGTTLEGLQQVGCNDDFPGKGLNSRVEFSAVAGRQYWIQVDGFLGGHGNFTLNWGADTTPPVNDNFANPTFIGGSRGTIRGNNCNATFEFGAGEPGAGVGGGLTVWYAWTAPSTTRYAFRTAGSSFDTVLCVFTGPALNSLVAVGCVDDTLGKGLASRVEFDAVAGTTYWIRVDGFVGAFGDILLSWGCWPRGFRIVRNPNHTVTISWADPGYTLQSTPTLLNTSNVWTDIPGASPITLPAAGASQFYRLQCHDAMAGLPDLIVNPAATVPSISIETFAAGNCEVLEGCATAGTRRLLRFGMETRNVGMADLVLGNPAGNPLFVFANCHMHYHFNNFAEYRLRRNSDSVVVGVGGKVGFCLEDVFRWSLTANPSMVYDCGFQGIQAGWADVYGSHLPCQYIDITGVAPGNYTLEMEIDPANRIPEANEGNNVATVPVTLQ